MSVDFHRHCQATVLSANGTSAQNGLSWTYISRLKDSLDNLPENWIEEFKGNIENITQDLASILKIMNSTVENYLPLSGGTMTGDLILNGSPETDNQAATKRYVDYMIEQNGGSGDGGSGTVTGIMVNGETKSPNQGGIVDIGNSVSSIKVNGDIKTPDSNGLVDIGTFSAPSFSVTNTDNSGTTISRINYNGNSYEIKMPPVGDSGSGDGSGDLNSVFDLIYPVGSIYLDANNLDTCPMQSVIIGSSWQKLGNKLLTGGSKAPVIGNGTAIGLTNGTQDGVMNISSGDKHSIGLAVTNSKVNVGQSTENYSNPSVNYRAGGLTSNPEKSGMVADIGSANGIMVNIWKRIA